MFYIIILAFCFIFLGNAVKIAFCRRWIDNEQKNTTGPLSNSNLYILVPVLNEQKIIQDTFFHFLKIIHSFSNVSVVFVTTKKESSQSVRTIDILNDLLSKNNTEKVIIIDYPYQKGVMAHQLNYAIKVLKEKANKRDFWIGVYNADSRIHENTIKYVLKKIEEKKNSHFCMQQYSFYYCNSITKQSIMQSSALWQSRWSVTFELFRVLFQQCLMRIKIPKMIEVCIEKMNYVIGHGFFINANKLMDIGGFPENTINEDAYLGYIINCAKIEIVPIPYFEIAESPNRLKVYINQQDTWYNGPSKAFWYYRNSYNKYHGLRAILLSFKLFLHAIYWVTAPIILYICCGLLVDSIEKVVLWIVVCLLHLPITNYCVQLFVNRYYSNSEDCKLPQASLACLPFYLLHCIGPIKNIFRQIVGRNTMDNKYKTER